MPIGPHRTSVRIMCGPLRLLLMRFPNRPFVFAGNSGTVCTKWRGSATTIPG